VRVAVESHADRGVAEEVLDELRVRATREQQGSARVPEVVPAYVRHPRALCFAHVRSMVQLVSCEGVYILGSYKEVCVVGALIRWLFRLLLFRMLVRLWHVFRRR